jgi:hypothetical protein
VACLLLWDNRTVNFDHSPIATEVNSNRATIIREESQAGPRILIITIHHYPRNLSVAKSEAPTGYGHVLLAAWPPGCG